jgi:hypothetical protein
MRHQRAEAAWSSVGGPRWRCEARSSRRCRRGAWPAVGESIVAGRRDQVVHEGGPVGQGRGVASAHAGVQVVLPPGMGLRGVRRSGGQEVAVGDGLCGSPDRHIAEEIGGCGRTTRGPPGGRRTGHPGANPAPRGITLLRVVRHQRGARPGSAVVSGNPPGQVRNPGPPRREPVPTHRHTSQCLWGGPWWPPGANGCQIVTNNAPGVQATSILVSREGRRGRQMVGDRSCQAGQLSPAGWCTTAVSVSC